jgi:predicted nuclease of restriction endonuclease-like (RecB) superfamily
LCSKLLHKFHGGTHLVLLDRVREPAEREWYSRRAIEHGWSRNVLAAQIASGLVHRQGRAATNFERTLPPAQSDLARELLKDPYTFDFLTLAEKCHERDLERALTTHIRDFLLELGVGFSFVGSQHRLEVGGREFFLDLLFYHLRLRCYVVVELKVGDFEPEFAGKMNFYLAAVDDLLRHPDDGPSLGIILCKGRNEVVVEYALRGSARPIGVTTFELKQMLHDALGAALPGTPGLPAQAAATDHGRAEHAEVPASRERNRASGACTNGSGRRSRGK